MADAYLGSTLHVPGVEVLVSHANTPHQPHGVVPSGAFPGKEPVACRASHGDDGFSSSVSLFEITDGLGDLATNTPPARRFFYNGPISKTVTFFLRETALLMLIAPFN